MSTVTAAGEQDPVEEISVDLAVVGAGPTGLFATYYAGFRGLSVAVVDSLPELGGQITAMYPEKQILDVAGFPSIKGRDLVDGLVAQAATAEPTYLLGRTACDLHARDDGLDLRLADGTCVHARALLVTAGIGTFSPRPLPAGDGWQGRGLDFFVPSFAPYAGKDVVVVGGGDSALDWAIHLEPLARSVTLVHRRAQFRAHENSVQRLRQGGARIITDAEVVELRGDPWLEEVDIAHDGATETVKAQQLVAALGFVADLGPIQQWGIATEKRHIVVDETMATTLPRVFAAGDVTEHPGKVRLIAVGFGEAATAVNNLVPVVHPGAHVFPGHSSEGS
ncbi:NAD(P)/FAD-dependent oxidoreductase [Nocardioides sp. DS6]|uniref:Ferredoxin--NADP reductase n=1 Tax=Nocardioides eburneus TaxID=3231482 RepID=A0ABV3SYF9_9ACTN